MHRAFRRERSRNRGVRAVLEGGQIRGRKKKNLWAARSLLGEGSPREKKRGGGGFRKAGGRSHTVLDPLRTLFANLVAATRLLWYALEAPWKH